MMTATTTREKKNRGLVSLMNQFSLEVKTNPATVEVLPGRQSVSFTERLNAMIAEGVSFDVSADSFQVVGADYLTNPQKHFLTANKESVMCVLQQSLLMKYLPIDLIPDFIFEVKERAAIVEDGADSTDTPFEIVRDVTREWFADLLDEMSDPASTFIN